MKLLQGCLLLLLIIILLPVAASCAGVSLLTIGAGATINQIGNELAATPLPVATAPAYIAPRNTPAPTLELVGVDAAGQAALDKQMTRANTKLAHCDELAAADASAATQDECFKQFEALSDQWFSLEGCLTNHVADVATCEDFAKIKH